MTAPEELLGGYYKQRPSLSGEVVRPSSGSVESDLYVSLWLSSALQALASGRPGYDSDQTWGSLKAGVAMTACALPGKLC
jgi:hypothetical protein